MTAVILIKLFFMSLFLFSKFLVSAGLVLFIIFAPQQGYFFCRLFACHITEIVFLNHCVSDIHLILDVSFLMLIWFVYIAENTLRKKILLRRGLDKVGPNMCCSIEIIRNIY